jgi:prophage regulatory protein
MVVVVHHLVGPQEVCDMLRISRQRLQQLASRPDFPTPEADLASGRIWKREAIEDWARRAGREVFSSED